MVDRLDEEQEPDDGADGCYELSANCPACGSEIYEDAVRCPICGEYITFSSNPLTDLPVWWLWLGLLGVIAVIAALMGILR